MHPSLLLESLDLGAWLPPKYEHYRPILIDGLACFLRGLPAARWAEMLAEQQRLSLNSTTEQRLVTLMAASPVLHKLGQVLGRHRALDAKLRAELRRLERCEPRTPMGPVRSLIAGELGGAAEFHDICTEPEALAEASVAVVVPFEWTDPARERRRGVFKVLRPGIKARLEEDLAALGEAAAHLETRRVELGLPDFAFRETFETVERLLRNEVCFEREQANLAAAGERHAGDPRIRVPALLPMCTPRLTAMERLDGDSVDGTRARGGSERRTFVVNLIHALVGDAFLSCSPSAPFHADPHAGNLLWLDDGRLGVLDWSLTGDLALGDRRALSQVVLAGLTLDRAALCRELESLTTGMPPDADWNEVVDRALRDVRHGRLPGPGWVLETMDRLARSGATFATDLLLFRKVWLIVEGVAADIDEHCSLDAAILGAAARAFGREWPQRWAAPFTSRDFATHLSNADLLRLAASGPAHFWNWWSQLWTDGARRMSTRG